MGYIYTDAVSRDIQVRILVPMRRQAVGVRSAPTCLGMPESSNPATSTRFVASVCPALTFSDTYILGQGSFGAWYILPSTSMVDSVTGLRYAECSRAPHYINIGFLGRWGTYACPQCLPSDTVPIRSWTRTLRPPGIRHRHLPYHTIPYHTMKCLAKSGQHLYETPLDVGFLYCSLFSIIRSIPKTSLLTFHFFYHKTVN